MFRELNHSFVITLLPRAVVSRGCAFINRPMLSPAIVQTLSDAPTYKLWTEAAILLRLAGLDAPPPTSIGLYEAGKAHEPARTGCASH